ncbi:MAG: YkgJ family cysteine cluster protein [Methanolobus sp.]
MNQKFRNILIQQLEDELEAAKRIEPATVAKQIHAIGFNCLMCGKCCRREHGDNRVAVTPEQIRIIEHNNHLCKEDIAEPFNIEAESPEDECYLQGESGMIDEEGNIHTFGWMLRRKNNCDCRFIPDEKDNNKCTIYPDRPLLCSTYPFYMENLELMVSECEGTGQSIAEQKSMELADLILKRYLHELKDTILTYRKYEDFEPAKIGNVIAKSKLKQGYLNYIVHTSEGTCRITRKI